MPYIKKEERQRLDPHIETLFHELAKSGEDIEGNLNYTLTTLLGSIPVAFGDAWRYKHINRVIGTLECVKQEFYRRLAGPYEDKAIEKNGDIAIYDGKFA